MEIKSINTSLKISKVHTATKNELGFSKGEIIFAKIVSIDGETITLQTREDMLFTAKVFSEIELAVGDDLKLAVKGHQGGKLIMQALSVNPDLVEVSHDTEQQAEESKLILLITNLLKRCGIEPTNSKVNEIIGGMEKTPGLDAKAAVFMSANEIEFTQEAVETVRQLESGTSLISKGLMELLGQVVLSEAFPESRDPEAVLRILSESLPNVQQAAEPGVQSIPEHAEGAKAINISVDPERNFYTVTQTRTQGMAFGQAAETSRETNDAEGANIAGFHPETAREAQVIKNIIDMLFEISGKTDSESGAKIDFENTQMLLPESEAGAMGERKIFQDKPIQEILTKILDMFAFVKESEIGAKELKAENENKTQGLIGLKEALKNSDIKNRDVLAENLDKTISQSRLLSEINRYTLLHIPVNMGCEQKTAEIYIYQRKKNKNLTDAQEVKILIGLDTENLGRFEVLITAREKNLSIRMGRGDDRANEVIGLRAKKLKKAFAEMGYNLSDFKIERLHEKTTPANAEEILMSEVSQSSFKINYTI